MSYILDALRRSEEERHQEQLKGLTGHDGLIHVNKAQQPIWPYLLILILVINVGVVLWIYLDKTQSVEGVGGLDSNPVAEVNDRLAQPDSVAQVSMVTDDASEKSRPAPIEKEVQPEPNVVSQTASVADSQAPAVEESADGDIYIDGGLLIQPKSKRNGGVPKAAEVLPPTVVVASTPISVEPELTDQERYQNVPSLIDMSSSFQKTIPSLTFNSHIYSQTPSARRVMINNIYLREGQRLSGLNVVMIGETHIVFDKDGTLFKRAVMRDW